LAGGGASTILPQPPALVLLFGLVEAGVPSVALVTAGDDSFKNSNNQDAARSAAIRSLLSAHYSPFIEQDSEQDCRSPVLRCLCALLGQDQLCPRSAPDLLPIGPRSAPIGARPAATG
jgi:hypothetical protein